MHVIFSRRYLLSPLSYPETHQLSVIDFIVYMLATNMHKTDTMMHNSPNFQQYSAAFYLYISFCTFALAFLFAYITSFYKSAALDFHHPSHMYIPE